MQHQQFATTANYSSDTDWWISDQEDELQRLPATPTFDTSIKRVPDIRNIQAA